jgi:NADPH-dependent 2,4-dienoyl-CoA reductase/sulfur reductase-like enzyme
VRRRQFIQLTVLAGVAGVSSLTHGATNRAAHARVVIVGGGFGGSACALQLRRLNPAIEVTLVDPDDRYVTCPMSNEAIVGLRQMRSITVTRDGLRRAGVHVARDRAVAIDGVRRHVRLHAGATLAYDKLVVAPGIRFLWGMPEGYDERAAERMPHAWKAGRQTEILAAQLRAMDDGGIVAISVPTGLIRCPPGPYERASLIADFLKRHKPRSKVLIFDANNRFPRQDVFESAWKEFYPGLIEWIPVVQGGAVLRVDARTSTLHTEHGAQRVAVANIIPPQAPDRIALDAGLSSGHGWCAVQRTSFESESVPHVHVIGDACIADAMPKSASAAGSQAKQCARAIVAALEEAEIPEPELESVCYSLLAPGNALSIHGRFRLRDGRIRESDASVDARAKSTSGSDEAKRAEAWYAEILADSFGV